MSIPRGDFCKSKTKKGCKEMQNVSTSVKYILKCKKYDEILEGEQLVFKCNKCKEEIYARVDTCNTTQVGYQTRYHKGARTTDGIPVCTVKRHDFDSKNDNSNKGLKYSKEEKLFIQENYFSMTIGEIAKILKRTYMGIERQRNYMGLTKTNYIGFKTIKI